MIAHKLRPTHVKSPIYLPCLKIIQQTLVGLERDTLLLVVCPPCDAGYRDSSRVLIPTLAASVRLLVLLRVTDSPTTPPYNKEEDEEKRKKLQYVS